MTLDRDRRRFLATAAMTMAAAQIDMLAVADGAERDSRELAAIGRDTGCGMCSFDTRPARCDERPLPHRIEHIERTVKQ